MKTIGRIFLLLLVPLAASAQEITYEAFLDRVAEKNAAYLAEKYNVDIAVATVQAAKVFNDPELSVTYGNNQDWNLQMGQSVEVGLNINPDLAGVRRSRIRAARSEQAVTEASVAAYLSSVKLEASKAWSEAWQLREACMILEETVRDMKQIAASDSLRLVVGDIGLTDATQSRLEATTMNGNLINLRAEYENALSALAFYSGGEPITGLAERNLRSCQIPSSVDPLYSLAEQNRADLRAAELGKTLSENNLKLVKATRGFELGIDLGYSYSTEVRNEIAPAPSFSGLTVGVSIPLKFSSFNKGEVNAAKSAVCQSEAYYEAARREVMLETLKAWNALRASDIVLGQYDESVLEDAHRVVESRKTGYLKGESSLMELIVAHQTYRDVMSGYIEACSSRFVHMAELEYATGYKLQ